MNNTKEHRIWMEPIDLSDRHLFAAWLELSQAEAFELAMKYIAIEAIWS